jgi:hypothetical protein
VTEEAVTACRNRDTAPVAERAGHAGRHHAQSKVSAEAEEVVGGIAKADEAAGDAETRRR